MLELMGANLNAFTADDETVYMTVAPAKHLATLMKLERLRMVAAIEGVKADVLAVEKDVVRNELRMRYENSSGAAFGYLMVRLFPKSHQYGRAAYAGIGNHESLNAIRLEDVASFVKENYGPDKTTIFVTGDFKLEDTWKLIEENLGYEVDVVSSGEEAIEQILHFFRRGAAREQQRQLQPQLFR
jgi:predicted Zn-dependent peptidase